MNIKKIAVCALAAVLSAALSPAALATETETREGGVPVPALMYHSLSEVGGDPWTLSPGEFAADMKYLAVSGYTGVTAAELAAYVHEGGDLPEKPVLITFDDGYYNNIVHALPLMEEYDMKLVLSVIGDYADEWTAAGQTDVNYGHASWRQLAEIADNDRVELSNHTQALHTHKTGRNGCVRKPGESLESYRAMLMGDVGKLQDSFAEYCGVKPICFAYPFGSKCPDGLEILKEMGFKVTLSCYEGLSYVRRDDPDCLFDMHRVNRNPRRTAEMILRELGLE